VNARVLDDRARVPADISVPEMEKLLGLALARGGSFSDLYFQHHQTSSILLEEGIIRTASAGVTCGLGVRVIAGERTGYAYTDDLSWAAMARAASTAAHIASDSKTLPPQPVSPAPVERRYGEATVGVLGLTDRIAIVERADRAARSFDPRIEKVIVSLADETKRVRIANSAGVLVEDVQPLFSIRVSVIAADKGVRREGSSGGGGRIGPEFFEEKPPEYFAREAARMAITLLAAKEAPAGAMPVVLGPGWPGILLHEAVGHGLEGDFNRKGTSAFAGRIGERVASPGVTVVDDGTPASAAIDDVRMYMPTTRPGSPLPHAELEDRDGNRLPMMKLVRPGRFLLIAGEEGAAWCDAAGKLAEAAHLPIDAVRIGHATGDYRDPRCTWLRHREISPRGAVLVRPDRFVGWRSIDAAADPLAALRGAMCAIELVADPATKEPLDAARMGAIATNALRQGVIVLTAGTYGNVLRLLPPINIDEALLADGLDVVNEAMLTSLAP